MIGARESAVLCPAERSFKMAASWVMGKRGKVIGDR
jgi:hypothetical protein